MKKNGFTLIELLAVIIILAIILTIAITSVSGIIENSKKEAFKSSLVIASKKIKSNSYISGISTGNLQSLELNPNNLEGNWEYIQGTNDIKFLAGTYDKKSNLILNSDILLSQFNTSFNPISVNYLDNTSSNTYASTLNNTTGLPLKNYKIYGNSTQTTTTQSDNRAELTSNSIYGPAGQNVLDSGYITITRNSTTTYLDFTPKMSNYVKSLINTTKTYKMIIEVVENTFTNTSLTFSNGYSPFSNGSVGFAVGETGVKSFTSAISGTFNIANNYGYFIMTNGPTASVIGQKIKFRYSLYELGSEPTSYVYNEFVPNSPTPDYPNQVVSLGEVSKNLIDISKAQAVNCTINNIENGFELVATSTTGYVEIPISLKKGSAYFTSFQSTRTGSTGGGHWTLTSNNTAITGSTSGLNGQYGYIASSSTTTYDIVKIRLYANFGGTIGDKATFKNVQLELGTTATEYKPFTYIDVVSSGTSSVTTTIDLTGHDPLRKIGDIYDYIDYANSRIVRNIGIKVFNGTESFSVGSDNDSQPYNRYEYVISNKNIISSNNLTGTMLSTHFIQYPYITTLTYPMMADRATTRNISFRVNKTMTSATVFASWLATQYSSGSPVIVYYKLDSPTYEPITLPPIPTLNGNTTLSIVGGGDISADYYQNK